MDSPERGGVAEAVAICHRILAGDKDAERDLFARFYGGVVVMLRRRLSDRSLAEDLANEALSKVMTILRSRPIEEPAKLAAFIHGVAANLARNAQRKHARQKTEADTEAVEQTLDQSNDPAMLSMRASLARVVRNLLASLPLARDRQILTRYYLEEDAKEDICRDLELTQEHFDRVVHRARQRMRAHIEETQPQLMMRDFLGLV
jgi:RNA polymerase sigma-70 factor (ECF subfamily)